MPPSLQEPLISVNFTLPLFTILWQDDQVSFSAFGGNSGLIPYLEQRMANFFYKGQTANISDFACCTLLHNNK